MEGVQIDKVTVEYTQEADDVSNGIQTLEVSTDDAGAGKYFVIKTERWAFDNIEEIINLLRDFEKRIK